MRGKADPAAPVCADDISFQQAAMQPGRIAARDREIDYPGATPLLAWSKELYTRYGRQPFVQIGGPFQHPAGDLLHTDLQEQRDARGEGVDPQHVRTAALKPLRGTGDAPVALIEVAGIFNHMPAKLMQPQAIPGLGTRIKEGQPFRP